MMIGISRMNSHYIIIDKSKDAKKKMVRAMFGTMTPEVFPL